MKRKIIRIDEEKCTGCGLCIPNCPEGAIQLIDDKARIISDLFCDGLGACIGHCPEGAISIEEREALPYDERRVMENIVKQGTNVIRAHLRHLEEHGEQGYLDEALDFLRERNIDIPLERRQEVRYMCPGSQVRDFTQGEAATFRDEGTETGGETFSELTHWPIQLHLAPVMAPHFRGKDILLSADCVAYAMGNFHRKYLKGSMVVIACPKLDSNQEIYRDKIAALIDHAGIKTLTVLTMEVPCCRGLLSMAREALSLSERTVPVRWVEIGVQGEILREEWLGQAS